MKNPISKTLNLVLAMLLLVSIFISDEIQAQVFSNYTTWTTGGFIQQFAFSFFNKPLFLTLFVLMLGMTSKVLYATVMGVFGISFKNSEGEKKGMNVVEPKVLLSGAKADNLSVKRKCNLAFSQTSELFKSAISNKGFNNAVYMMRKPFIGFCMIIIMAFFGNNSFGQIAQRGSATSNTSTTTSLVINVPTGVAEGDIMIANLAAYNNPNPTSITATGWTQISSSTGLSRGYSVLLYRVVTAAAEPATYTFAANATTNFSGAIVAFSGVNPNSPFDVTPGTTFTAYNPAATTFNVTAVTQATTVNANAAVLFFASSTRITTQTATNYNGWAVATSPTLTELFDVGGNAANSAAVGAAWGIKATTGATGAGNFTNSTNDANLRQCAAQIIALKPLKTFYSKGSLAPQTAANWNTKKDGTGTDAVAGDFTGGNFFVIQNGHSMTTGAVWSVSGAGSEVQIENGGTLTATSAITLAATTTFQIDNGGTYQHGVNSTAVFAGTNTFGATSTVLYNFAGAQSIFDVVTPGYGNLTLAGTGTKTASTALDIQGNILISSTFAAGASQTHNVQGNWTNNGTFSFTTGSTINFNGNNALQTISGSSTTTFGTITVAKTAQSNILDITSAISLNAGGLTLTSGTFKLSGTFSLTNTFFSTAGYTIPAAAGFWLNNANVTVTAQGGSPTLSGLLRVSNGNYNIGTGTGNTMTYNSGANLTLEGGAINVAGRFCPVTAGTSTVAYNQSGGVITVCTVGSASGSLAPFDLGANGSNFTMSSGSIVFQNTSSNAVDYLNLASTNNVTGGTVQFGNTSTTGSPVFVISSSAPVFNLTVNSTGTPTLRLATNVLTVKGTATIGSGTTLDAGTNNINMNVAGDWTNNGGTFTPGTGTVTLNGTGDQAINGSASTTFANLTINTGTASVKVTNATKAFALTGNLAVTKGNLVLQATNADYTVTGNLSVAANGTLTHEVDWDIASKQLTVSGNLTVDGAYSKGTVSRAHVSMNGSGKTISSGTSSFNILTLPTTGTITASGDLTVDNNFWAPFYTAGTFNTGGFNITANGALLVAGSTTTNGIFNITGASNVNVTGGGLVVGYTTGGGTLTMIGAGTLTTDGLTLGDTTGTNANTITQSNGALIVNGSVTINQPTPANTANTWNINARTATVSGLITFAGTNVATTKVGKIVITTGTLNANGGITFVGSNAATKVIDMSGGAGNLNLKGALTVPTASSTLSPGTSSTFSYVDAAAQTINKFSAGSYYNLAISGAGVKTFAAFNDITNNLSIATGASADLGSELIHTAASLTLGGSAQSTGSSYGGTGSAATTINATYFTNNTGIVNVGSCTSYSLTSTTVATSPCINTAASVTLANTTTSNLPVGTYTVYYTLSGANTGSFNATMSVATAGSGSFSTGTLSNNGSTTITVNYIRIASAGCVSKISSGNTATVTVTANVAISSQSTATQTRCISLAFTPITVTATGVGLTYQWYSNTAASTTGGTSLLAANGAQTNSYTPQSTVAGTLYYYCVVSGTCGTAVTSAPSGAFITNALSSASCGAFITKWNLATAGSGGTQLSFSTATSGTVNYYWQEVSPGTASGSGTFSGSTLTITGLPIGATIRLGIYPTNFQSISINNGADKSRLLDVEQWGTSAWTSMSTAFYGCNNLNITATDIPVLSSCTSMRFMFTNCTALNSPSNINSWNTAAVTDMSFMFYGATAFNQNIGSWNTAPVTKMNFMFTTATAFNQNIGSWNTAAVNDMNATFFQATSFNQNIGSWNTAAVTNMTNMFADASAFNNGGSSTINNWNTAAVTGMSGMFGNASAFNQNIGNWNLNAGVDLSNMLNNSGMDCANYATTLVGWNANVSCPTGRALGAFGRTYGTTATAARANLILATGSGGKGWTITDGGQSAITISSQSTATQTRCISVAFPAITVTATGVGLTYQWYSNTTASTSGGTSLGAANGAQINSYTPQSTVAGTLYYYCIVSGTCGTALTSAVSGAFITNANKTASAASSTPTLCINTALTNITHTTTGATGIGTATGLPAGVTAAWASNTITISGTPTAVGTFGYSIPLTGGCGTVNATGTITVTANTAGVASSTPTVCINTALTNITHATTGATGIGAATNLPAGVTAAWAANTITISGTPTALGTFSYSIPLTGGCGSVNATGTITVTNYTWTGATSTDWHTAGNWVCGVVPTATSVVSIPSSASNQPVIGASAVCNSIAIASSANLTISGSNTITLTDLSNVGTITANAGTLSIGGTFTNTGTFTAGTGTVNYNGTGAQTLAAVTYNNLTLSGTGDKTAPTGTLTILGNLSRSGTHSFAAGTGRVSFAGTAQQVYSAAAGTTPIEFWDVYNSNTVGLRLDSTIGVQNELNLTSTAKLDLNTGNVNLRSTNTRTAHVTDLGTTAASTNITYTGAGRFNIERYLPSVKSWRLLAAPIVSEGLSITAAWREGGSSTASTGYGTQITGPASSTGMDAVTTRGSMKWYNKASNTYTEITNTADAIARPQGYYVFVRGDRAQNVAGAGSATNLRMKGKILTGSQTFSALTPATAFDGFESVGNPYPSQINFKTVTKSNIEPTYTVWNPSGGYYGVGRFVQYVSTTGLNGDYKNGGTTVNTIESGQAFFIQSAIGVAGSITIKESDKATGSNTVSRAGVTVPTLEVDLNEVVTSDSTNFLDHVVLNFDSSYSNSFDGNDVRKFMNSTDNLAIKVDTRNLILESRAPLTITDTIYLALTNTRVASYQFKIDPSVLGNLSLNAFLVDKFLVTETPVSLTSVTTVPFSTTSDAASRAADRFMIVFRPGGVLPVTFTGIAAAVNTDKTHTVKWFVSNEVNLTGYAIERSANGVRFDAIGNSAVAGNTAYSFIDASPLATLNYYRVKATSANGQVQYSAIVKLSSAATQPGFSIQPNPVVNKTMHLNFQKMEGLYSIRLTNKQGATVFTKQMTLAAGSQVKDIQLGDAVAAGVYDVVLVDAKGKQSVQTIFVQ